MKKFLSTVAMLAMVLALSSSSCGGSSDDEDEVGGSGYGNYDDTEYCQIFINGEDCTDKFYGGGILIGLSKREKDGKEVYAYGGMTEQIKISQYDGLQYHIVAGYTSSDLKNVFPHSKGTYEVISSRGEYVVSKYPDNIGMLISGGNMKRRTVTSGSLQITKVTKYKNSVMKSMIGREDVYASEGTFDFILTDDWDGNENHITGKFRVVY